MADLRNPEAREIGPILLGTGETGVLLVHGYLATGQMDELELPDTTCTYAAVSQSTNTLVLTSELSGEKISVSLSSMQTLSQEDAGVGPLDLFLGDGDQSVYIAVAEEDSVRKFTVP